MNNMIKINAAMYSGEFLVVHNIKNKIILYKIYIKAYFYYFYLNILYMYISYFNYSLTQSSSSNMLLFFPNYLLSILMTVFYIVVHELRHCHMFDDWV